MSSRSVFHFGEFELEIGARSLVRGGERVRLGSKAFEVLTCLVMQAGEVVTKDELLKRVWPNSFVEENNLSQHIFSLRRALGDRADYIVTIPGRGYQFTGQVRETVPIVAPAEAPKAFAEEPAAEEVPAVEAAGAPALAEEMPQKAERRARGAGWGIAVGALGATMIFLAAAGWLRVREQKKAEHLSVVMADLVNSTGDDTFDRTLQRALEIDLEQSPAMDVMSPVEAAIALKAMGRRGDEALTPDVAREVCERSKRQVLLTESIASMGREYLLMLEAMDCTTGKKLVGAKAEAASKEEVLRAQDGIVAKVRAGLGGGARR